MARGRGNASGKKLYKVLVDGCAWGGGALEYSLPTADGPGDWHEVTGPLVRCQNGLHLTDDPSCRWQHNAEAYIVEVDGETIVEPGTDEVVARRIRLVRRLTWAELAEFGITPDGVDRNSKAQIAKGRRKYPPVPPPVKGHSPAMQLVSTVWENRCGANEHSWRRVNSSMHEALSLAISGGLSFAPDDFRTIRDTMRGGYWMGDADSLYSLAVEEGNIRACISMETAWSRKPFMWEGKRLHVGSTFEWSGVDVTVTSFRADALVACSYEPKSSRSDHRHAIDKRFTISHADLARAESDRKIALKVQAAAKRTQEALSKCRIFVAIETVIVWTPEQRAEAEVWAKSAHVDAGKKRVQAPHPPPHVVVAKAIDDRNDMEEEVDREERLRAGLLRSREYHTGEISEIEERLAKIDALRAQLAETPPSAASAA